MSDTMMRGVEEWMNDPSSSSYEPEPLPEPPADLEDDRGASTEWVGETWRPVDLRTMLAEGYETPTPTIGEVAGSDVALFYPGRINSVFGDSGGGKTWLALMLAVEVLRSGRDVVLVDYEDHAAAAANRLRRLGVDSETVFEHLLYINPHERWSADGRAVLVESLAERDVALALIDSTGESMAVDGVNPNSDDDVARWFRGVAQTLARDVGAAVVLLDHVVKEKASGHSTSFASGSQRKRAGITGAAYYLDVKKPPSRDAAGLFTLTSRKDRFGWRTHGTVACEVTMEDRDDDTIEWSISQPLVVTNPDGSFRPTHLMERISRFLEDNDPDKDGLSVNKILKTGVNGERVQGRYEFLGKALETLIEDGYCTEERKGQTRLVRWANEYREADDRAHADKQAEAGGADLDEPF